MGKAPYYRANCPDCQVEAKILDVGGVRPDPETRELEFTCQQCGPFTQVVPKTGEPSVYGS